MGSRERPILVTGVPRSGTTWLARSLAAAPGTSMPGREPMNPRGKQFALGDRLDSWVRREAFSREEATALRRCYAGREPRTYSRYGVRQWRAPLPTTRVIIKDPFAVLSLAAVVIETQAVPVLIYRHPAAVLASYRRRGWTADTEELVALGAPATDGDSEAEAMAVMWAWLHQIALADLDRAGDGVIVSHSAMSSGGASAMSCLASRLGLAQSTPKPTGRRLARRSGAGQLHDFTRSSAALETGWQARVTPAEVDLLTAAARPVWDELETRQLRLPSGAADGSRSSYP